MRLSVFVSKQQIYLLTAKCNHLVSILDHLKIIYNILGCPTYYPLFRDLQHNNSINLQNRLHIISSIVLKNIQEK